MKRGTILTWTTTAFLLQACAASTPSGEIEVGPVQQAAAEPCAGPVILPDRALSDAELEVFWRRDRIRLVNCREKHAVLADYAKATQAELSGE